MGFVYNLKSSPHGVCIRSNLAFTAVTKINNLTNFFNFVKKVSGHDILCDTFLESASHTAENDTKYDGEFRNLSTSRSH